MTINSLRLLFFTSILFLSGAASAQDLYLSVIMDGDLAGGLPKAVRVCATADINDLSLYGIGSANNGVGTDGQEYTFEGELDAGDCLWVSSESMGFTTFFGCPPDVTSGAININGNDAIELYFNGSVVDLYGLADVNGSGECWEYSNGYAYRQTSMSNNGLFDSTCTSADWIYSGPGGLIGISNYAELSGQPFGPYDNTACESDPDTTYYASIDTSMTCEVLKNALHDIISTSNNIPYGPSSGYDVIDFMCDADYQSGQVLDRYANTNYTNCLGDRYTSSSNASGPGAGWNREHVFPSSWWGGSNTATQYTDLHNLFPSDAYTNALKSNFPLGKVQSGANGNSAIGVDINSCATGCNNLAFEPADQYKGDLARVFLYMAVRYKDELPNWASQSCTGDAVLSADGLEPCLLNLLLLWHQDDPVDGIETSRNNAIFETQGNRNPFVDMPSWATDIWGISDGTQLTSSACDPSVNQCLTPAWEIVEVQTNSSFNNGGQWTASANGYTCNSYCGTGCAEYAESWLIYGPLDMSQTSAASLNFTAEEDFGYTLLEFFWTNSYTGCPTETGNNWTSLGQLDETLLTAENTAFPFAANLDSVNGTQVYLGIQYADDGSDGYNYWRLDDFNIIADVCPALGTFVSSSCASCPADINADGLVNVNDFLDLNTAFGSSCTSCAADINGDGLVNVNDFLDLNTAFGTVCP